MKKHLLYVYIYIYIRYIFKEKKSTHTVEVNENMFVFGVIYKAYIYIYNLFFLMFECLRLTDCNLKTNHFTENVGSN